MSIFGLDLLGFEAERERQEVIAFYGIAAYNQIAESERRRRDEERLRQKVLPDLVDDVASQVRP